jgi:hypothetical protein
MRQGMRTRALETTVGLTALCLSGSLLGAVVGCADASTDAPPDVVDEPERDYSSIPAPAADGPPLFVVGPEVKVAAEPRAGAAIIGELRMGAAIARSDSPVSRDSCEDGWYAVHPRGFVCLDDQTSLEGGPTNIPAPNLDRALPYRYGLLRSNSPIYKRVPTGEEQLAAEPKVGTYLKKLPAFDTEEWGNAVNDVPLDDRGQAAGPPVLLADGEGAGPDGRRTTASWFSFGPPITPTTAADSLTGEAKLTVLRKKSGLAITATVTATEGPDGARSFGVTPRGHFIPIDRLTPALGTGFHGIDLGESGLPVVFVQKYGVTTYEMEGGKAVPTEDEVLRRTAVPMTGKFRTVDGVRYEETQEGAWLRTRDVTVVFKRHKLPDFAVGSQKWVDVSLATQTMVLYEGTKPIYATMISPGRDVLGDPETTASTPQGVFRVTAKRITQPLDPREVEREYDVEDAPWALEFAPGAAFVGNYWFDQIGRPNMFHGVALSPIDARRLWMWAGPELPEGWHGVVASGEEGTIINVRK